jgi:hypothetical protein
MGAEGETISAFQQANSGANGDTNYWVMEGVATFLSTFRSEDGKIIFGGDERSMSDVRTRLEKKKLPKIREVIALSYDEFLANAHENYALSSMLTTYLLGKDKAGFLEFLREVYSGNPSPATFTRILGSPARMDTRFRAWLRKGS